MSSAVAYHSLHGHAARLADAAAKGCWSVAGVTAKLESMESLRGYVYKSHHLEFFKRRAEWFEKATQPTYALWWIEVGHIPTVAEAKHRLNHYRIHGATQYSFWFSQPFPEPQKELLHA